MSNVITMEEPAECIHCGWVCPPEKPKVEKPEQPEKEVDVDNSWLIVQITGSSIWLYVCPKCTAVMANKNAVENTKRVIEIRKQKIAHINSPLILPQGGHC